MFDTSSPSKGRSNLRRSCSDVYPPLYYFSWHLVLIIRLSNGSQLTPSVLPWQQACESELPHTFRNFHLLTGTSPMGVVRLSQVACLEMVETSRRIWQTYYQIRPTNYISETYTPVAKTRRLSYLDGLPSSGNGFSIHNLICAICKVENDARG